MLISKKVGWLTSSSDGSLLLQFDNLPTGMEHLALETRGSIIARNRPSRKDLEGTTDSLTKHPNVPGKKVSTKLKQTRKSHAKNPSSRMTPAKKSTPKMLKSKPAKRPARGSGMNPARKSAKKSVKKSAKKTIEKPAKKHRQKPGAKKHKQKSGAKDTPQRTPLVKPIPFKPTPQTKKYLSVYDFLGVQFESDLDLHETSGIGKRGLVPRGVPGGRRTFSTDIGPNGMVLESKEYWTGDKLFDTTRVGSLGLTPAYVNYADEDARARNAFKMKNYATIPSWSSLSDYVTEHIIEVSELFLYPCLLLFSRHCQMSADTCN